MYFSEYSRKYVNAAPAKNTIENLNKDDYDYIEIMELIDNGIDETLETLYKASEKTPYYRATGTDKSFADLADEFNYIRSVKVSGLFSRIFKYQLTKNKVVLVSDYTTRIDNNNISNAKEESIVNDVVKVIDEYVKKMRDSGNTNITSEYILDNLHERNLVDSDGNPIEAGDQTVTYDELVYSWRDHNEAKEHSIIDSAYCKYILDTFQKCTGACENGECASSGKTCTELHDANYPVLREEIDSDIANLLDELNGIYNLTTETNDEYNEYLGASYISVLSSSSVKEGVNVRLYTLIAFFFLMVLCFGGAIVFGRIGDIIDYVFYTDRMTGLSNRAYFDRYLKSKDKKLLDDGVVYSVVDIANLAAINNEYSHAAGDDIIKLFASYLKEAFGKTKPQFFYNGNGSFIIVSERTDYITVEDILGMFRARLDERDEFGNVKIEYRVGIAETFKENRTARKLFAEAIRSKRSFVSDAVAEQK